MTALSLRRRRMSGLDAHDWKLRRASYQGFATKAAAEVYESDLKPISVGLFYRLNLPDNLLTLGIATKPL